MKKIIEHGYKSYKTRCDTCNCKFTYDIEDIDGTFVSCPECGSKHYHTLLDKIPGTNVVKQVETKDRLMELPCKIGDKLK